MLTNPMRREWAERSRDSPAADAVCRTTSLMLWALRRSSVTWPLLRILRNNGPS